MNKNLEGFQKLAHKKILLLDGAIGTEIQALGLAEEEYRGEIFADHAAAQLGNNDLLSLTQPKAIAQIHRNFLDAGADIITTNSFCATSIAQADYGLAGEAPTIAGAAAKIARQTADQYMRESDRPVFVAGALGPTNKTLSISPKVEDPAYRDISFEAIKTAYANEIKTMRRFVDFLLIETVFDTLNAKTAIIAAREEAPQLPLMISGTITDNSGRTLSGQTPEAFLISVLHANPLSVGLNCALGAKQMRPMLHEIALRAPCLLSAHPNAGLPNEFGAYDETPEQMAAELGAWAREGLLNIVGGCCGTTPAHIRAISEAVKTCEPREMSKGYSGLTLSGLEPFKLAG